MLGGVKWLLVVLVACGGDGRVVVGDRWRTPTTEIEKAIHDDWVGRSGALVAGCKAKPLVRAGVISARFVVEGGRVKEVRASGLGDRDADTCVEGVLMGVR